MASAVLPVVLLAWCVLLYVASSTYPEYEREERQASLQNETELGIPCDVDGKMYIDGYNVANTNTCVKKACSEGNFTETRSSCKRRGKCVFRTRYMWLSVACFGHPCEMETIVQNGRPIFLFKKRPLRFGCPAPGFKCFKPGDTFLRKVHSNVTNTKITINCTCSERGLPKC